MFLKNKICYISISVVMFIPSHIMANSDQLTGAYAGITANQIYSQASQDLSFDAAKVSTPAYYNLHHKSKSNTTVPELFIGYGRTWDQYYLGVEASLTLGGSNVSINNADVKTSIVRDISYGTNVRLGIYNANILWYTRIGVELAKLRQQTEFVPGGRYNSGSMLLSDSKRNNYVFGGRFGLGMEYFWTEKLALRLEYTYSIYQTLHTDINHRTITFLNPIGTNSYQLSSNQFSLGFRFML